MSRLSGEGIVYSAIDVKKWAAEIPSAESARPACCSRCGAASRPLGGALALEGHGLRERQVRGPSEPLGAPETRTIRVRRYRCRLCGGLTTVLPRGLTARRHYSASAIGLSVCLYGMLRLSIGETRQRVCTWRVSFEPSRWTTLPRWVTAISQGRLFPFVRGCPSTFSLRERAERAGATLCGMALSSGSPESQAFFGAALSA